MADEQTTQAAAGSDNQGAAPAPGVTAPADDRPGSDPDLTPEGQKMLDDAAKGIPPARPSKAPPAAAKPENAGAGAREAVVEQEPPQLDLRLLHAAERAGIDPDTITALGDKAEGVLRRLADGFDSISAARGAQQPGQQQQQPQTDPNAFDLSTPFSFGAEAVPETEGGGYRIGGEVYDKGYVDTVLRPQERYVEGLRQSFARMQAEQMFRDADSFFQKVAPEYGEFFGKERMGKLNWNSPQGKARMAAIEKASELMNAAHLKGNFWVGLEDCLEDAKQIVAKDHHRKAALEAVRNRQGQFTQRPTSRQTPDKFQTARERGIAAANAKIAEINAEA